MAMKPPPVDNELPELTPDRIADIARAWVKETAGRQRARLVIELEGGRYVVRTSEEAWGEREIVPEKTEEPGG